MDFFIDFIKDTVQFAPFIIATLLIVNSVGLPISEDVIVITAGVLSVQFPNMLIPLYLGCFIGAYLGDISSYWIWRLLGSKLLERPFWKKRIKPEKIKQFKGYFDSKGPFIIIIGRFIPFGVRVLICLTAGVTKYHYVKFASFNLIAAFISTATIFTLSYFFGESVQNDLSKLKFILFIAVAIFGTIFFLYRRLTRKKEDSEV